MRFFLALCVISLFTACQKETAELVIYGIKGSSGVGMVYLFEEPPQVSGFEARAEALATADLIAARLISGEAKIGILPPNMAAKIYSSGRDIKAAAVIGTGMLSLLSSDASIRSIADLRGKTVDVAMQGATPDFIFRRILRNYGIAPNTDIALSYSLAPPEIAQSLIAGRISTGLLPEPFATMALLGRPDLHQVADIQREWLNANGVSAAGDYGAGNYPMTLLVVDGAFAAENPQAVSDILNAVKSSIEQVTANPAQAGALVEKHELGIRADIAAAAIPKSGYVFIKAQEARSSLEDLFAVFLENDPDSIGGYLPDDGFYLK